MTASRWKLALALPVLLVPALAGCGGDDSAATANGFDAVSISGQVGSEPTIDWKGQMSASATDTRTLVQGDGPALTKDDTAYIGLTVGNGYDRKVSFTSYKKGVGGQSVDLGDGKTLPVLTSALVGAKVGSRLAITANAQDVFGEAGNPDLKIGNQDPIVLVVDVLGPYAPTGSYPAAAKGTVPGVTQKDGTPTALVFGAKKPPKGLQVTVVSKGTGPKVTKDGGVEVDYLGQVYGASKPFDESFSKKPISQPVAGFVKGFTQALVGVPAGSRLLVSIPPSLGYGKDGNAQAKIKGTDTIVFAIDVLGAS